MKILLLIASLLTDCRSENSEPLAYEQTPPPPFWAVTQDLRCKREGLLTCISIGTPGCRIVCEIFCDLYGCLSDGYCESHRCQCRETYQIQSQNFTVSQYRQLPSAILWYYKFGQSQLSRKIYKSLQETDIWSQIETLLRNPSQTATDIKDEILQQRPDWRVVEYLKPVKHGYIEDFVEFSRNKYDYDHFQQYIDMVVNYVSEKHLIEVHGPPAQDLTEAAINSKYLYKIVALCQNEWLMNYIRGFARRKGYNDEILAKLLDPDGTRDMAVSSVASVVVVSAVDHIMTYERHHDKLELAGSRKHTLYYMLSKKQIDDLNDIDFEDSEENKQDPA